MKAIIILDQIQAGLGGKERADTPLGGKKLAMGSAENVAHALSSVDGEIMGTFYCGTEYYQQNRDLVQGKFARMSEKMAPDIVILGPTYDYPEFATMACELGDYIQQNTKLPVILAIAQEKNEALLPTYQDRLTIVKMPKKGGTGLSDSLEHLAQGCAVLASGGDVATFKSDYCYHD
jgi:betaine reductase